MPGDGPTRNGPSPRISISPLPDVDFSPLREIRTVDDAAEAMAVFHRETEMRLEAIHVRMNAILGALRASGVIRP